MPKTTTTTTTTTTTADMLRIDPREYTLEKFAEARHSLANIGEVADDFAEQMQTIQQILSARATHAALDRLAREIDAGPMLKDALAAHWSSREATTALEQARALHALALDLAHRSAALVEHMANDTATNLAALAARADRRLAYSVRQTLKKAEQEQTQEPATAAPTDAPR